MTIETEAQANVAIAAVADWLLTADHGPVDDYAAEGEERSAVLARQWATALLSASTANGLYGCALCQS